MYILHMCPHNDSLHGLCRFLGEYTFFWTAVGLDRVTGFVWCDEE